MAVSPSATVTIDDVLKSGWINASLPEGREIGFALPAGTTDGHEIRLKGQGFKLPGMQRGDAVVNIRIAPDPRFTVDGFDLHAVLPISIENAVLGTEARIDGPAGPLDITVPAWSGSDKTIAIPGTDIGRALDEAFRAMERKDRRKILVLLTDGEDLEQSGVRTAEALAKEGVVVFTLGVGTAAGAEIRILNERNQPELVRDSKGEPVRSRLDETTLRAIAAATKGNYFPLGSLGEGLDKVRQAVETTDADSGAAPVRKLGVDRFHIFVAIVLVLLVMESLIGTRRWGAGAK